MEKTASIFDIGRFRNEDGPGIRTIIFFKGCPLNCTWCSNPFGLAVGAQLAVNRMRCNGCERCVAACKNGVNRIEEDKVLVDFPKCELCGDCILKCSADTRMISGKKYTARQLYQEAYKDVAFYRKNAGGVTLSGGEILMQYEVAADTLRMCRNNYISTCIETSGFAPWEHFKQVAQYCNLIFVDIKHMNSKKHKEYTGVPNERILDNIHKLCDFAIERKIVVVVRRPVIPNVNDQEEEVIIAAKFVSTLAGNPELNLIPYHNLGEAKYHMIGKKYDYEEQKLLSHSDPRIVKIKKLFEQYAPQNRISIGGEAIDLSQYG